MEPGEKVEGINNTEENKENPFDCFIKIFFNTKTKEFGFETNVPDAVTGYGLCDMGKMGVDSHIAKMQAAQMKKIIPAKHGMLDFVRGKKR